MNKAEICILMKLSSEKVEKKKKMANRNESRKGIELENKVLKSRLEGEESENKEMLRNNKKQMELLLGCSKSFESGNENTFFFW